MARQHPIVAASGLFLLSLTSFHAFRVEAAGQSSSPSSQAHLDGPRDCRLCFVSNYIPDNSRHTLTTQHLANDLRCGDCSGRRRHSSCRRFFHLRSECHFREPAKVCGFSGPRLSSRRCRAQGNRYDPSGSHSLPQRHSSGRLSVFWGSFDCLQDGSSGTSDRQSNSVS